MRVTVLGCGPSSGVPRIGNDWGDCDPTEPRNRRTRPSILIEAQGRSILVDTSPDLREQLLAANVRRIDAVLYTHAHADHTHGIDDLRGINALTGRPIDVHADADTLATLKARFGYCFEPLVHGAFTPYKPDLRPHEIRGAFEIGGVRIEPFVQDHGFSTSLGFRIGRFAYSTDVIRLDEAAFSILEGIDTWIVDCQLLASGNPVHADLPTTLAWIERIRPRRAYLTHMSYYLDYHRMFARLPAGIEPAYDGLVIEVDDR